ncbi:hypothetical protein [Aliarcobacter butzleri]|uniref:hypothetical protein n=1 Tax=Aliarcobacter butzleri TaxID=28197 RepID=UPI00344EF3B5
MIKKIVITNHSSQRRTWMKPIKKDILYNFVRQIDDKYKISQMEISIYKVWYKGGFTAIIKNDINKLILITIRDFKNLLTKDLQIENIDFLIKQSSSKDKKY